jgi:uncharacterized alpha/beta hydrolase family protein
MNVFVIKKKIFFGFLLALLIVFIVLALTARRKSTPVEDMAREIHVNKVQCVIITPTLTATPEATPTASFKRIINSPTP